MKISPNKEKRTPNKERENSKNKKEKRKRDRTPIPSKYANNKKETANKNPKIYNPSRRLDFDDKQPFLRDITNNLDMRREEEKDFVQLCKLLFMIFVSS